MSSTASTIPALTIRRAETTVELGSGESFALAGLLQHNSTQHVSKVPWIGDIPVIGAVFRSDRFQRGETDLVIIVTPYLVQPSQLGSRRRPTVCACRTMLSACFLATNSARGCPHGHAAHSMPAAAG